MLAARVCDNCGAQFAPRRLDQRLCCRKCHDEWFLWEKRQALAHWREMQRQRHIFFSDDDSRSEAQERKKA